MATDPIDPLQAAGSSIGSGVDPSKPGGVSWNGTANSRVSRSAGSADIRTSHTPEPAPHASAASETLIVIEPARRLALVDLRELWAYRGLFLFLAVRDIKLRYAQTVLGIAWALIQPVLTMIVFTVIFGNFAKIPSEGVPYPVFALAALVMWTYFANSLSAASNSLILNSNLITKVYFPRIAIPLAPIFAGLLDFAISLVLLLVVMLGFRMVPSVEALVVVPVLLLLTMMAAAGVGCWLAALNIQYRDVRYVTPFVIQVWMYASPIVYPISSIPPAYRPWFALNPMTGVIAGVRASLLGTPADWSSMGISAFISVALFLGGTLFFQRTERRFADVA
jgi:lipopolysaccharide transport system permease protein